VARVGDELAQACDRPSPFKPESPTRRPWASKIDSRRPRFAPTESATSSGFRPAESSVLAWVTAASSARVKLASTRLSTKGSSIKSSVITKAAVIETTAPTRLARSPPMGPSIAGSSSERLSD